MLHELLEPVWLIDDAGLQLHRALVEAVRAGRELPKHEAMPPAIASIEEEGLSIVAGPHTMLERLERLQERRGEGVKAAAEGVYGQAQLGPIVVIPVTGMIVQHRSWITEYGYGTSTEQVLRAVQMAIGDPQVSGVMLRINSTGGTVAGLKTLADFLLKARGQKVLWGHADSTALSAGYWLLACCEHASAAPLGLVGSVGCLMVHMSHKAADDLAGLAYTVIRAGKYKADASEFEDLSDGAKARLQALVDEPYGEFVIAVGKGRGVSADKVRNGFGQGATVGARQGLIEGMVDAVVPFQDDLVAMAKAVKAASKGAKADAPAPLVLAGAAADQELLQEEIGLGLLGKL